MRKLVDLYDIITRATVIHFSTHGCQAQIHEYEFIGHLVGSEDTDRTKFYKNEFMYLVKILHSSSERFKEGEIVKVPAWYCTREGGDIGILFYYN